MDQARNDMVTALLEGAKYLKSNKGLRSELMDCIKVDDAYFMVMQQFDKEYLFIKVERVPGIGVTVGFIYNSQSIQPLPELKDHFVSSGVWPDSLLLEVVNKILLFARSRNIKAISLAFDAKVLQPAIKADLRQKGFLFASSSNAIITAQLELHAGFYKKNLKTCVYVQSFTKGNKTYDIQKEKVSHYKERIKLRLKQITVASILLDYYGVAAIMIIEKIMLEDHQPEIVFQLTFQTVIAAINEQIKVITFNCKGLSESHFIGPLLEMGGTMSDKRIIRLELMLEEDKKQASIFY